ncbi:MAG: 1-deoxy-D-xylulose-5-phosphate reductoisomerase [Lachnospiraceae bacterium]|jgi:1-deoxy-D-xylulose-5-phosphate reductoisomerase|nr:1-deoxy-D-xylulose-5-phosphate reductoisomerase [Lachnospiraceae bacterium]
MINLTILGSTGSIGTQALDVARYNKDITIVGLAAGSNVSALEQQIREFSPRAVCLYDEKAADDLRSRVADLDTKVLSGMEGLLTIASLEGADTVLASVVGMIGIQPAIAAIKAGKRLALANKETLVCAGHIIMPLAAKCGVPILPVDSEHSAIFQCLNGEDRGSIAKILLTASGGPFRGKKRDELLDIKPEDALKHPNWSMGRKITIDSSTLVNKGLEVMEAKWLFGVETKDIQVVVQPKSVIHSMVEFADGAVMAQLGLPDMKLPIQYALYYPERRYMPGERLDFAAIKQIAFEEPDTKTFKGLPLAYNAMERGGNIPTVYNAANEEAVAMFLDGKIAYPDITDTIEECMESGRFIADPTVDDILDTEREIRDRIKSKYN